MAKKHKIVIFCCRNRCKSLLWIDFLQLNIFNASYRVVKIHCRAVFWPYIQSFTIFLCSDISDTFQKLVKIWWFDKVLRRFWYIFNFFLRKRNNLFNVCICKNKLKILKAVVDSLDFLYSTKFKASLPQCLYYIG